MKEYYLGLGDKGAYGIYIINPSILNREVVEKLHQLRDKRKLIGHIHTLQIPYEVEGQFLFGLSNFFPDLKGLNGHRTVSPLSSLYTRISEGVKTDIGRDKYHDRYLLTRACLIRDVKKLELEAIFSDNKETDFNRPGVGSYINYPIRIKIF